MIFISFCNISIKLLKKARKILLRTEFLGFFLHVTVVKTANYAFGISGVTCAGLVKCEAGSEDFEKFKSQQNLS